MFYNNNIQKEKEEKMKKEKLKETNEGRKIKMEKMLRTKKRNNANSFGCNNSNTFDISRSKYKRSIQ